MPTFQPVYDTLPELAGETLSFALHLREAADPGDAYSLRTRLGQLLDEFVTKSRQAGLAERYIDDSRFALIAFLDEIVLNSNWYLKDEWLGRPLQMQYFETYNAGEDFYKRLEELRRGDVAQARGALEVYFDCLALGFKGKHADLSGMEVIKRLCEDLSRTLGANEKPALAPNWVPPDSSSPMAREFPVWIVAVLCLVLLVAGFVLARTSLEEVSSATSSSLKKLMSSE